ncbi:MAG: hypothetical protein WCC17_02930 [Candidatus Nitrosopolaris sp.]
MVDGNDDINDISTLAPESQQKHPSFNSFSQLPHLQQNLIEIVGLEDMLTSIVNIADRMSELGWNAEQIFSLPLREIEQTEPARINKLVSEGDNICTDLQSIIPKLDKLRRDLS